MKKWFLITLILIEAMYSFSAAAGNCRFYPPIDGDNSIGENVKAHPDKDSYAYLVQRDLFGDGKNFVLYPVYSKDWLLTSGKLREIVLRDKANVIGDMDVPVKITVIQSPHDASDFKPIDRDQLVCSM